MARAKRHVHKYHRVTLSFGLVWACGLPDCNHYMPQHMNQLVEGKNSLCWQCNIMFVLDANAMKEDRPRCFNCRTGIKPEEIDDSEYQERLKKIQDVLGIEINLKEN